MNRREFSMQAASALGLGLAGAPLIASAQGGPVEGQQYTRLAQAAPVSAPAGKVEVVEFFWYGCPHCYHFEPSLAEAYRVDGVPTLGIGGQFTTSVSLNGNASRTLATVDFLVDRLRKG